MKIGFAGRWDPLDKNSWSGTYYYSYRQLQKEYEVDVLLFRWNWLLREQLLLRRQFHKRLEGKKTAVEFLKTYAKYFSKELDRELCKRKVELLFVPAAPQLIAYLQTPVPVIFLTDATFQQIQGYYQAWQNFAPSNIREGIEVDKRAFQRASYNLLASEWCKSSAIKDYGIPEKKISVVPFGANLDQPPLFAEEKKKENTCRLLFLGVEWERKGGPLALEAFRQLRRMGLSASLHIIGCTPPVDVCDEGITVIPYLNKNIPAEQERLNAILRQTHFLLLPTRAECAGVVFCEASAYGIPSLTTDTGGVTTYVRNGVNGYALPMEANGNAYAQKMYTLFNDFDNYRSLSYTSRQLFEEELNWERWREKFKAITQTLV